MRSKLFIAATLLTLGLFGVGVAAQSTDGADSLQSRVQKREARLKEVLTTAQQTRLKARCKGAQLRIAAAEKVAVQHHENQDRKISVILSKLKTFEQKQKDSGGDTTELDNAITKVAQLQNSVDEAYNDYISALEDAAAIDCEADPAGFKASLVDAREQFKTLISKRQEIRKSLKDDLLPALKSYKPKEGNS